MSPQTHGTPRGVPVDALAAALGGLLTLVRPAEDVDVDDITLAEPEMRVYGLPGDLLLAVGVDSSDAAVRLVDTAAERGVRAVVVRRATADEPAVRAAAETADVALLALADDASWAHVVWLLRGVLDGVAATTGDRVAEAGLGLGHEDLFALAEACAALVAAPVTIEDTRSRVLAHSAGLEDVDPTRLSTIVGRRVPQEVLLAFRARGVFRRMARSSEPFFVPVGRDASIRGRYIVPVWAAGEWLGSIWAVVDEEPPPEVGRAIEQTARVVALHLLRLRSQSDLVRSVAAERVRSAVSGHAEGAEAWLPPGPWRVASLPGDPDEDPERTLERWESVARRNGWRQPLLAVDDGQVLAVVTEHGSAPGSWTWLGGVAASLPARGLPSPGVAAGSAVVAPADLVHSRAEAVEIRRRGLARDAATSVEDVWAELTVARAALVSHELLAHSPVALLHAHDDGLGTAHATTLAAWLAHPGDPRAAAADVGIHPNTLRHRMARVADLLGPEIDLADPTTRLALQLQLR